GAGWGEVDETQLSPAGRVQIDTSLEMLQALETHLADIRRRLLAAARGLRGAKVLTERLYGVGPVTALALVCWLGGAGRFSSSRKAVRFAGGGCHRVLLRRQTQAPAGCPGKARRCCAGPCTRPPSPTPVPAPRTTPTTRPSRTASAANARPSCEARKIVRQACHILTDLGDNAFVVV